VIPCTPLRGRGEVRGRKGGKEGEWVAEGGLKGEEGEGGRGREGVVCVMSL